MAAKELLQGRGVKWLADDETGAALVTQVGAAGVNDADLVTNYDSVSSILAYVGKAAAGSAESDSVWQVKRLVFNTGGDVTTTFADGNAAFDNSWSNRTSLTYS